MSVGVDELGCLLAGRTFAAGLPVVAVTAVEILDEGQGYGHGSTTVILVEQYGVGHPPVVHHRHESLFQLSVSCYL